MKLLEVFYDKKYGLAYNDRLNPKFWSNKKLLPKIAEQLLKVSKEFIEFLEIPELKYEDIIFCGSNANYNYTDISDIDLHIIVDFSKLPENCPALAKGFFDAKKALWNKTHNINFYNQKIELYVQSTNEYLSAGGIWSITYKKWLQEPQKIKIKINDHAVRVKADNLAYQINELINDKMSDLSQAQELLDNLYIIRKSGLKQGGEFSVENLAFKAIRNIGLLDKLKEYIRNREDKELSLAESIIKESMDIMPVREVKPKYWD